MSTKYTVADDIMALPDGVDVSERYDLPKGTVTTAAGQYGLTLEIRDTNGRIRAIGRNETKSTVREVGDYSGKISADGPQTSVSATNPGQSKPAPKKKSSSTDVSARYDLPEGTVTTGTHQDTGEPCLYISDRETGMLNYLPLNATKEAAHRLLATAPVRDDGSAPQPSQMLVAMEAAKIRTREAARELVNAEKRALVVQEPFDADLLADVLKRPEEPPYRVEGLIPSEASTLVVAMRKTGKTTLLLNLAYSLITGEPFLGRFEVQKIEGRIAFLNFEVSAAQIARWAVRVGIAEDRFYLVNLRGRRNPLSHADDRERLAEQLRAQDIETLIVDPFGRAYGGTSQDNNGEVGAWLTDLDLFARGEVGVRDLILATHAGWGGERSRGASALEDWPDSIITLTRDEKHDDIRYFKAMGRDVMVDEDLLAFDPETSRLTLTGTGSRSMVADTQKIQQIGPAVVAYVLANPGCSQTEIENNIGGNSKQIRRAVKIAADAGEIQREKEGQKYVHNPPRPTPANPGSDAGQTPTPSPVHPGI